MLLQFIIPLLAQGAPKSHCVNACEVLQPSLLPHHLVLLKNKESKVHEHLQVSHLHSPDKCEDLVPRPQHKGLHAHDRDQLHVRPALKVRSSLHNQGGPSPCQAP